jgi:MFS family permease
VTGWAWAAGVLGYVVVAVLTARWFIRADLERAARNELKSRKGAARYVNAVGADTEESDRWASVQGSLITQRDRDEAASTALSVGACWPVFWVVAGFLTLVGLLVGLITMGGRKLAEDVVPPTERDRLASITARRERQELEVLRKQARDLDLPFPGDDA